jgi:hypothetical protein
VIAWWLLTDEQLRIERERMRRLLGDPNGMTSIGPNCMSSRQYGVTTHHKFRPDVDCGCEEQS